MKKKREFNLKQQYRKSWEFIKESKIFIYTVIIIFFIFSLIGFLFPAPEPYYQQLINLLRQLAEATKGMSTFELIRFILFNNLQSSFVGVVLGVILGIVPVVLAFVNGYLLGFVSLFAVKQGGFFVLWKLLPHGIFELPAIFISLGMGLRLGFFIFQKNKIKTLAYCLLNIMRIFFLIILPLLIIAAIIEGSLMSIP